MRWVEESDWPKLVSGHLRSLLLVENISPRSRVRACSLCQQEGVDREATRVAWQEDGTGSPLMWFECGALHRRLPVRVPRSEVWNEDKQEYETHFGEGVPQLSTHWIRIEVFWQHFDERVAVDRLIKTLEVK